ncbi:hypothetical protein THASP1DRAFT_14840 [Thamnocephalis sphaerospora]|uniref:NodB homology domain-containing protein n=1 Tax=Thamnocephalis sphaerospora TaxID=78915 RepID=A0A4V1IWW6_9FUNG|nr:hypothetical protein THASP1DRAFT_14840 [Thamnocephalis sphaerospora]|eukprot:RKP08989.1 hypothetical protein THASP1DRAFT_14840 [Thamnocephalis sphaerospora]
MIRNFLTSLVLLVIPVSVVINALPASAALHQHRRRSGPAPGAVVYTCATPKTFALTFDDGPGPYEDELLNQLDRLGVKATFFVNGDNAGSLDDPALAARVQRAYKTGHQIASHTYSHADLTKIGPSQVRSEMTQLEGQLKRIIGVRPTYMRPPYGSTNGQVLGIMRELGYRVVNWDIDTNDWRHPNDAEASLNTVRGALRGRSRGEPGIILSHSTMPSTAHNFVTNAVQAIRAKGYRLVRIDECLGDPNGAYRQ